MHRLVVNRLAQIHLTWRGCGTADGTDTGTHCCTHHRARRPGDRTCQSAGPGTDTGTADSPARFLPAAAGQQRQASQNDSKAHCSCHCGGVLSTIDACAMRGCRNKMCSEPIRWHGEASRLRAEFRKLVPDPISAGADDQNQLALSTTFRSAPPLSNARQLSSMI
jgi:hypothetical protein